MEEIELKLVLKEVNVILGALGKLPFEEVADVIMKVRVQGETQIKALQEAANPVVESTVKPKK